MNNPGSGNSIWLRKRQQGETGLYVDIHADSTREIETAYAAALKAGGKDEGAPVERVYFARGYAFDLLEEHATSHAQCGYSGWKQPSFRPGGPFVLVLESWKPHLAEPILARISDLRRYLLTFDYLTFEQLLVELDISIYPI